MRNSGRFQKGRVPWNKGRSWDEATKSKVSETKKRQALLGVGVGKNNGNYKHGLEWRTMKRNTLLRFDYTCQCNSDCHWHKGHKCGFRDEEINQFEHIKPRAVFKELENDPENHSVMCPNCHARKTISDHKLIAKMKKRMNSGELLPGGAEDNPEPSSTGM